MAVVSSNEIWERRKSTGDWQYNRTHTRAWRVETNDRNDDGFDVFVGAASASPDPIPTIYQAHPSDPQAFAKSATADPDGNSDGKTWIVVVTYDNKVQVDQGQGGTGGAPEPNPTLRAPKITWGNAKFSKRVTTDRDDEPILNSASQPFDPPLERDFSRSILTITRIEQDFDDAIIDEYTDTVNDALFYNREAGTGKMDSITTSRYFEDGVKYDEVTYVIHFDPDGWAHEGLDIGTKYINDDDEIVPTDGNVKKLLDGEGGLLPEDEDAVYLSFNTYPEKSFGNLNLE